MPDIDILNDVQVELIDHMGSDASIVQAAQVSLKGENEPDMEQPRSIGILNYLLREKHGSPFEHTTLKFYVKAPIFVFREFHRHRVGFSYNEMSGRYTTLPNEFYVPSDERPLVNVGTSSKPDFAAGSVEQFNLAYSVLIRQYESAWHAYQVLLHEGVANEVARLVLPVGIMSQMYVTCNVRSLLNFLSLRTQDERATHRSRPQYEIELVARKMEAIAAELFPETLKAYNKFGRVAP